MTVRPMLFALAPAITLLACSRPPARESASTTRPPASSQPPSTQAASTLSDSAKIDSATARRTALARVPHGKVVSEELEQENGRLVYSFDIQGSRPGIEEVQVDARDGRVVSVKHESPSQETDEARQERENR
jgi:peptidase YpeB-like protein